MKKQTGWPNCPKCEGTGEQLTEKYKSGEESMRALYKLYKGDYETAKRVSGHDPDMKNKFEPCSVCLDTNLKLKQFIQDNC